MTLQDLHEFLHALERAMFVHEPVHQRPQLLRSDPAVDATRKGNAAQQIVEYKGSLSCEIRLVEIRGVFLAGKRRAAGVNREGGTGIYGNILKALAWEGINVSEVVSTLKELTIVLEEKLIDAAFSIIKRLFWPALSGIRGARSILGCGRTQKNAEGRRPNQCPERLPS